MLKSSPGENQAPGQDSASFTKAQAQGIFGDILKNAFSLRSRPPNEMTATCQEIRRDVQTLIAFTAPLIEKIKLEKFELRKKLEDFNEAYKANCSHFEAAKAELNRFEEELAKLRKQACEFRNEIHDLNSEIEEYMEQIRKEKSKGGDNWLILIHFDSTLAAIISVASKKVKIAQSNLAVKKESLDKIKVKLCQISQDKKMQGRLYRN